MNWGKAAFILTVLGFTGIGVYVATRDEDEAETTIPPTLPPEDEEIIDAEYRSGDVFWAALTEWLRVYTSWPNEWPADTDLQFAWGIKNIGNVPAYFQVYIFTPGDWIYLDPGEETTVYENLHTPAIPVTPYYQYNNRITILARKLDGTRIGSVWTSEEFEILYV